jgi:hypothetical protein
MTHDLMVQCLWKSRDKSQRFGGNGRFVPGDVRVYVGQLWASCAPLNSTYKSHEKTYICGHGRFLTALSEVDYWVFVFGVVD